MRGRITERVVTVGGGTGSYTMLSELKRVANSALGGRRHDRQRGLVAPAHGPVRSPVAPRRSAPGARGPLRSSRLWSDLFRYRFPDAPSGDIGGHSLGNLILHALEDINEGELLGALADAQELLDTVGHVLPVTLARATLCAELSDGTVVRGETEIDRPGNRPILPIERSFSTPGSRYCRRCVKPCSGRIRF